MYYLQTSSSSFQAISFATSSLLQEIISHIEERRHKQLRAVISRLSAGPYGFGLSDSADGYYNRAIDILDALQPDWKGSISGPAIALDATPLERALAERQARIVAHIRKIQAISNSLMVVELDGAVIIGEYWEIPCNPAMRILFVLQPSLGPSWVQSMADIRHYLEHLLHDYRCSDGYYRGDRLLTEVTEICQKLADSSTDEGV